MKLRVDPGADALYLRLDESTIVDSEEVKPGVVLDFNAAGQVVGVEILQVSVEILHVSSGVAPEQLRTLQFETA
jgi:uncharacterized protein YuzE